MTLWRERKGNGMGSGIGKILAGIFGVILLGAIAAMDFYSFARKAEGDVSPTAYVAGLTARIAPMFDRTPPISVADHLAPAPAGWDRHPLIQADAEAITGLPYDKDNATPDLTQDVVKRLLLARYDDRRISESYVLGGTVVAVRVEVTSATRQPSQSAKLKRRAEAKLRDSLMLSAPYLESGGLTFHALKPVTIDKATGVATPVEYRRFWAGANGRLEVEIVTNASDEQLLPILLGMDARALIAMTADAPPPADADVTLADAAPVAPPEAVPAEAAQTCIRRAGKLTCK